MIRRLLAALLIPTLAFLLAAHADDSAKPKAKPSADENAVIDQERMKYQFTELKAALLRLAQRLEHSSRAEDRDRAATLKDAIKKAGEIHPERKFDTPIQ